MSLNKLKDGKYYVTEELNNIIDGVNEIEAENRITKGNVNLVNNWTAVGGSFSTLEIIEHNGFVEIHGLVTGGDSNVIGSISAIFRPKKNVNFAVAYAGGTTGITITQGGTISLVHSVQRTNIFLDGIRYFVGGGVILRLVLRNLLNVFKVGVQYA